MKDQTVKYILEDGKSASKVAVELGIDKNTVWTGTEKYQWVIRRQNICRHIFFAKVTLPSGPCEGYFIQVQVLLSALQPRRNSLFPGASILPIFAVFGRFCFRGYRFPARSPNAPFQAVFAISEASCPASEARYSIYSSSSSGSLPSAIASNAVSVKFPSSS